jgi:hypothetical protein
MESETSVSPAERYEKRIAFFSEQAKIFKPAIGYRLTRGGIRLCHSEKQRLRGWYPRRISRSSSDTLCGWAGSQILPSLDLFRPTVGLAICTQGVGASAHSAREERSLKNRPAPVV